MESNPVVALILALAIIIAASRIGGAIARQFGQPRVLGELIIGVVLGPTIVDFLEIEFLFHDHAHELEITIKELAEIGVLFLMFIVGLKVHMRELISVGLVAAIAGVLGALAPVALTIPVVLAFDYSSQEAVFAGVVLAATSVSISAQVLLELGLLHTKEGNALLATALIDDVIAILLVSLAIAFANSEGGANVSEIATIILRMGGYIIIAGLVAWYAVPLFMGYLAKIPSVQASFGIPALALVIMFLFSWAAEELGGVATITGAFIAGIGLSRSEKAIKQEIEQGTEFIAYAFLVPIFFVDVGLETDLSGFPFAALPLGILLLIVAVISKIGGVGIGARLGGFTPLESLRLSACMISRGEVGLIIATLGITTGILDGEGQLFADLFLVILLTTVLTPPMVRWVFNLGQKPYEISHPHHS